MKKKRNLFERLVASVEEQGPLAVTVLAVPAGEVEPSPVACRAARQLVGAVAAGSTAAGRVNRLATLLDELRAADISAPHAKNRHAS